MDGYLQDGGPGFPHKVGRPRSLVLPGQNEAVAPPAFVSNELLEVGHPDDGEAGEELTHLRAVHVVVGNGERGAGNRSAEWGIGRASDTFGSMKV